MTFTEDLQAFRDKVERRARHVFVEGTSRVRSSVTDGDPVTGAPGQPVDTGTLKGSWQEQFVEPWRSIVSTNVAYARAIEEGVIEPHERQAYTRSDGVEVSATTVRGSTITLRSEVGGFHSVKLTRAGWPRIVRDIVGRDAA